MKYIAAYALCVVGGNATPSADDVKNVITAAGGEANDEEGWDRSRYGVLHKFLPIRHYT